MARTVEEIFEAMVAQKDATPGLDALDATSSVAVWRLLFFVVAAESGVLEQMWDVFQTEINTAINTKPNPTDIWLAQQATAFQDGFNVTLDEFFKPVYSVTDDASKIVSIASAKTSNLGICDLKVAKGEIGNYEALSSGELVRFSDYIKDIKPVGVRININSLDADLLKADHAIYFDPSYESTAIEEAILLAINNSLNLLEFNGVFYLQNYIDVLQSVPGVVDVVVADLQMKPEGGVYGVIGRRYFPLSGYLSLDQNNSTFTYIAES